MATYYIYSDYLAHHGILGQKWGVRRYQNADGSYTSAGRQRYDIGSKEKAKRSLRGTIIGTAALGPAGALAGNLIAQFGSEETFNRAINIGKTIIGASLAVIAGVTVPSLVNNNKDSIDAGRAYTKANEKELGTIDLYDYFSEGKKNTGISRTLLESGVDTISLDRFKPDHDAEKAENIARQATRMGLNKIDTNARSGHTEFYLKSDDERRKMYSGQKIHDPVTRNINNAQIVGRNGFVPGGISERTARTSMGEYRNPGLGYDLTSIGGVPHLGDYRTGYHRSIYDRTEQRREPNESIFGRVADAPEISDLLRNNRRKNN